jgi:hypothetical protein
MNLINANPPASSHAHTLCNHTVDALLEQSLTKIKGLSIYIGGQVISAIFVQRIDANTIELRNQSFERIVLRMDRIDAIAIL